MRLPRISRGDGLFPARRSSGRAAGWVRNAALAAVAAALVGCDVPSFIDPSELTPGLNYKTGPALQKPILNSLSSIDKTVDDSTEQFTNVTEVQPQDLQSVSTDYVMIWISQRVPGAAAMRSSPVIRAVPVSSARAT